MRKFALSLCLLFIFGSGMACEEKKAATPDSDKAASSAEPAASAKKADKPAEDEGESEEPGDAEEKKADKPAEEDSGW